ncbi:MAG: NAD-dependent epimerase/dehydratase family protein, partial [Rhabdochlamydiaceae bacterium]
MKVAVIGATGHIGNNLCRSLLEKGYHVKALVHQNTDSLEGLNLVKATGDILDPQGLRDFLTGCEVVFHAAGKISIDGDKDGTVYAVNVTG